MPRDEFDSPMAKRLEKRYEQRVATYATKGTLAANVRRIDEFMDFGRVLFSLQGRAASDSAILGNDTVARLYLVDLADKNLGKNVVPATASMIQTHRALAHPGIHKLQSLKGVQFLLESISKRDSINWIS